MASAPLLTLSTASSPSPDTTPAVDQPNGLSSHILALTTLSRNTSVISTSSSSSSSSSFVLSPIRPRPLRTFSNHSSSTSRPHSPRTPTTPRLPAVYMPRDYDVDHRTPTPVSPRRSPIPGSAPRSRSTSAAKKPSPMIGPEAFDFGDVLGHGSYSTVIHVTHRATSKVYAMKVLDKEHIKREKKVKYPAIERQCLTKLAGHPGVIRLYSAFQDSFSLYFVLSLAPNGELLTEILKLGSLSSRCTQYYAAQLADTLEYIHNKGIVHRDVKPENILLDEDMRLKLTDFGSARILESVGEEGSVDRSSPDDPWTGEGRKGSFVGSAIYASPELLLKSQAGQSADIWALGNIIFYMVAGTPPFKAGSDYLAFEKIKHLDYHFPEGFDEHARDLITQILILEPAKRPSVANIKSHPFLASIDWSTLWTSPPPPLEHGMVKNDRLPVKMFEIEDDGMWDEGEDEEGELWDGGEAPRGGHVAVHDQELERVRRMYGGATLNEPPSLPVTADRASLAQSAVQFPIQTDIPLASPSPVHPTAIAGLDSPSVSPALPSLSSPALQQPPPPSHAVAPSKRNSGGAFVVLSRPGSKRNSAPSPVVVGASSPTQDLRLNGSPNSVTSSEGSPIEPLAPQLPSPVLQASTPNSARRLSQPEFSAAGLFGAVGLGLGSLRAKGSRAFSSGVTSRRGSATTSSSAGGSAAGSVGLASRRGSTSQHTSTTPDPHSRSGSVCGTSSLRGSLMADLDRWSQILLPSEQVLFSSPILVKSRRSLLPAKRRILVLTDHPRLLCVKEDRAGARLSIKSRVAFLPAGARPNTVSGNPIVSSGNRPAVLLSKISEDGRSEENLSGCSGGDNGAPSASHGSGTLGGRNGLTMTPVAPAPNNDETANETTPEAPKDPADEPAPVSPNMNSNLIQSVDGKGDKCFTVRTATKSYTYIAEDADAASRWVKEIDEAKQNSDKAIISAR